MVSLLAPNNTIVEYSNVRKGVISWALAEIVVGGGGNPPPLPQKAPYGQKKPPPRKKSNRKEENTGEKVAKMPLKY